MLWTREKYPIPARNKSHNSSNVQATTRLIYQLHYLTFMKLLSEFIITLYKKRLQCALNTVRTTLACEPVELEMADAADLPTTFSN
jgi:hypothetical protein